MTADAPLTADEKEAIRVAWRGGWSDQMVPKPPERMVAAVESILLARETALRETIAQEVIERGPVINYELNYDGTEDPLRAAYVEGHRDAVGIVRGQA